MGTVKGQILDLDHKRNFFIIIIIKKIIIMQNRGMSYGRSHLSVGYIKELLRELVYTYC